MRSLASSQLVSHNFYFFVWSRGRGYFGQNYCRVSVVSPTKPNLTTNILLDVFIMYCFVSNPAMVRTYKKKTKAGYASDKTMKLAVLAVETLLNIWKTVVCKIFN